jgi:hypothetical protein
LSGTVASTWVNPLFIVGGLFRGPHPDSPSVKNAASGFLQSGVAGHRRPGVVKEPKRDINNATASSQRCDLGTAY